ncbi:MAG: ShlB/FhaC/HecB family hemolysin secretion/activation protein [Gammaproteobacteria bacterium]
MRATIRRASYLFVVAAIAPLGAAHAQTPQLPPSAQPGATQPRDLTSPLPEYREPFRIEIPPMIERPLGIDEGVRIFVTAFEVRGILQDPNAPELGAQARATVQREFEAALALVEQQRLERQQQTEVGDDGFTPAERERVVEFMSRALTDMTPDERARAYQDLVDELGDARLERNQGLTIGQIQQVADAVTAIYQQAGFFLARAVVPAQEVTDGVVVIQVLEGRVGKAVAENNQKYSERLLVRPFTGLEGELITVPAMEDALLVLSDYPGLQAFGTFRPGEEVGTADIVVSVQAEDRFAFSSSFDNHGTDLTGEYRFALTVDYNNPVRRGDQLSVTAMKTMNPDNTTLGQLNYRFPLRDPRNRLLFDASRNAFDISGGTTANLSGLSTSASIGYERVLTRGRNRNWYFQTDFARKRGESFLDEVDVIGQDDLAVLGFQVRYDRIVAASNVIESGFLRLDHGFDDQFGVPSDEEALTPTFLPQPGRQGTVPSFDKVTFGYSRLKAMTPRNTLLLRLSAQWSDDRLAPMEQFSIGGANQLRALPVSHYLGDRGMFASAEWTIRMGEGWTSGFFYDYAVGWENRPILPIFAKFDAGGFGVALNYALPGRLSVRAQQAWVDGGQNTTVFQGHPERIEDRTQTWLDLNYQF